jgi:spermidine/putrescine transport system permease protein
MRRHNLCAAWYVAAACFLYTPLAVLILFSFNEGTTLMFPLKGLTLRWYREMLQAEELLRALRSSLIVAAVSSAAATALGTMAAIAVTRFRFPGRDMFLTIGALPLVIPYVVLGVALLILFSWLGVPLSLWTAAVAHATVSFPYVMLIVSARLNGFAKNLEEASMDLGATYWGTLRRVTLPICAPALLAGLLSSFTTSFDEFALSFFLTGTEGTLPVYLYSQLRFPGRLPLVLALASVIIVLSFLLLLAAERLRHSGGQGQLKASS